MNGDLGAPRSPSAFTRSRATHVERLLAAKSRQAARYSHSDASQASWHCSKVVVETFQITGKGHGTEVAASKPINPAKADGPKCGKPGAYIIEAGSCSTYHAAKFFGLDGNGAPGAEPGSAGADGGTATSSGGPGGEDSTGEGADGGKKGTWVDGSAGSTCTLTRRPSSLALLLVGAACLTLRRRVLEQSRSTR
jgi:hypothetical protein